MPVAGTYAPAPTTSNGGFPPAERHSVGVESARLPPPPQQQQPAATTNGIPPHGTFQGYHHHHQPPSYAGMSNQGTPFQPPATIPGARDPSAAYQPAGIHPARDPSAAYQPPGMPQQRDVSYQPPTRDPTHDPAMHAPPHGSYPLPPIATPATPYTATPQPYAPNPSFQHLPPPPPTSFPPGPSTSAERLTGLKARHEDMYAHHLVPAMASRQLLPEIGKLARDMLRSADEKVGIAIGTYNTVGFFVLLLFLHAWTDARRQVDRHIRSLDAALQAQQAALNLGIRQDTLPSKSITGASLHPDAQPGDLAHSHPHPHPHASSLQAGAKADAVTVGRYDAARDASAGDYWRAAGDASRGDPRMRAVDALNVGVSRTGLGPGPAPAPPGGFDARRPMPMGGVGPGVGQPQPIVLGYMAAHNFDLAVDPNEPRYW